MCTKEFITLTVNYYSQMAKAFTSTDLEIEQSGLLVFDSLKNKIRIQSPIDCEFEIYFEKRISNHIEKYKHTPFFSKMANDLKKVDMGEILPIYCNILEIWLAAKQFDLHDKDLMATIHKKTYSLATFFVEPFMFHYNPNEDQIENVKQHLGTINSSTMIDFIFAITKLFDTNSVNIMNFAVISFDNSECFMYPNCFELISMTIGRFDENTYVDFFGFMKKKIDKLKSNNHSLYELLEEKLKTANIYKLLAFLSPLMVFFVDREKCFENHDKTLKLFKFVYLISLNLLTNPIINTV